MTTLSVAEHYSMTSTVAWFIEKRVIHLRMFGAVEAEELCRCWDIIRQYTAAGNGPVHVLLDCTAIEQYRSDAGFHHAAARTNPKTGWVVLISPYRLSVDAVSTIAEMSEAEIRVVPTLAEGLSFLAQADRSLITALAAHPASA
jgi:hypothetical protein